MPRTQIVIAVQAGSWLAPLLTATALWAAAPHARTAANFDQNPAFQITGENYPSDEDLPADEDAVPGEMAQDEVEPDDTAIGESVLLDAVAPGDDELSGEDAAIEQSPAIRGETLSPRMHALRQRVREALAYYQKKHLNTRDHNPWEVMHSIVAYGVHSELNRHGPDGAPVNAISWLCWNGDCKGTRILEVSGKRVAARKGPQVQGHPGQFLAILAQSNVATNCPMKVGDQRFTLDDLIESEKLGCQAGTELTFKLISLSHYLDTDARWKSSDGQNWSIERLVREELSQPIIGAACGGTHRLMGFAYAVRNREMAGRPISGEFRRARKYLDDYHTYALTKLQNADGSFSTEWFKAPGARPDLGRRIQTSGHILEWLSYSLPLERLDEPRVVKAVEYLSDVLLDDRTREWEVGPLGHALHSLAIYDARAFRPLDNAPSQGWAGHSAARNIEGNVPLAPPALKKPTRVTQRQKSPQNSRPAVRRAPSSARSR